METLGGDQEFQTMDLTEVLTDEVASLTTNHPNVAVETNIQDGLSVVADGLIHQLFSNLLENAVAHNDPEALTIRVSATINDEEIDVVVSDDGAGIPAELREDCFEMGRQGPGSDGDGLGLYLVSRLADVYGGTVALVDGADGATFQVTLPNAG